MRRLTTRLAAAVAVALALSGAAKAAAPDLTLSGVMTGADHQTYREVPFRVPEGVSAVTVEFEYTGKDQRAVIDLGLRDPQRFRGWSGGNKARFTVAETYATPSYLPGPLPAGEWRLILGAPNLRQGTRAEYTARINFQRDRFDGFAAAPVKAGPGWYRGDLHAHTAHSDGSCASRRGVRVPCPTHLTLEAAEARGLDFIAVTDHNTSAHHQDLAELQAYYDDLLLIPGREVTTFYGHANVFGAVTPLEFQLGSRRAPSFATVLDEAERAGAVVSVNHPGLPSGEDCMGCGWTASTDWRRIAAVEAVNGGGFVLPGGVEGPLGGIGFWEARLNEGFRITAVGGSDNHDAAKPLGEPQSVGRPTTVVHARELSQAGVLEGLRSGRVFVDLMGTRDRILDVSASSGEGRAEMGGTLAAPAGAPLTLAVHVAGAAGGRISLAGPAAAGFAVDAAALGADETRTLAGKSPGGAGWLRVDVRGPDGALWLLGNPVYLNR